MKFRSIEEIDAEISRLNKAQSTTSMSLSEEKKLVKEIEVLRQQKKQLGMCVWVCGCGWVCVCVCDFLYVIF